MYDEEFGFNYKVILSIHPCRLHFFFQFSVVGVLKSILQIFFGSFVFDRLTINLNTIFGIALSLVAGSMFSYYEYTNKQKKSGLSTNNINAEEEQNPSRVISTHNIQDNSTNLEKFVPHTFPHSLVTN